MTVEEIKEELAEILTLYYLSADYFVSHGIMFNQVLDDKALFDRSKNELIHSRISSLYNIL